MRSSLSGLLSLVAAAASIGAAGLASAEEPKPAGPKAPAAAPTPKKPPTPATDAEAAAALATFEEEFRARGLTDEDRLSQRDFAMSKLAKVHHSTIVARLGAIARGSEPILRTLAVIYLGDMTLHPGLAGPHVLAALKKDAEDSVLAMSAMQAIGRLRYLGAVDPLRAGLESRDWAVRKATIVAIGNTADLRLLEDLLGVVGIQIDKADDAAKESTSSVGAEQESEGYSWEGVEVTVDTDDELGYTTDQNEADRQGQEQMRANEAAAHAAHGGGGGGGGDEGGGGGRGGAQARSPRELLPGVIAALQKMTGERFTGPKAVLRWTATHREDLRAKRAALDEAEREQRAKR